jgi:hypothetical protein
MDMAFSFPESLTLGWIPSNVSIRDSLVQLAEEAFRGNQLHGMARKLIDLRGGETLERQVLRN